MSKVGVISDVHGNLQALERALEVLDEHGVERIFICGDVVGYGSQPNDCCELIRKSGFRVVAGNHDWAVAGLTEYEESHSPHAVRSIERTREEIAPENLEWLSSLPLTLSADGMEFVHASLDAPE